ncbi:hypothetical protein J3E69DRAFT_363210 [Trichoderma sp. SZMC 28015]
MKPSFLTPILFLGVVTAIPIVGRQAGAIGGLFGDGGLLDGLLGGLLDPLLGDEGEGDDAPGKGP